MGEAPEGDSGETDDPPVDAADLNDVPGAGCSMGPAQQWVSLAVPVLSATSDAALSGDASLGVQLTSSYHAPLVVMLRTKIVANGQRVYSDWSTWELPAGASVDLELSIATAFQLLGDTPDYPASVVIEGRTLRDDGDQFTGVTFGPFWTLEHPVHGQVVATLAGMQELYNGGDLNAKHPNLDSTGAPVSRAVQLPNHGNYGDPADVHFQ